jgi:2-amino-4-hydroxy-6-hydroxymethyldihydropteridine diphosphokinase
MVGAFIAAGSNIEPAKNIKKAVQMLSQHVLITGISTVYQTEPIGRPEQQSYYNCVLKVETDIQPKKLKYEILGAIETVLGRVRTADKFLPRTIDLDLIIYDNLAGEIDGVVLPDSQITERPFLAFCLYELEPKLVLPGINLAIADVCSKMSKENMKPLKSYTTQLQKKYISKSYFQPAV